MITKHWMNIKDGWRDNDRKKTAIFNIWSLLGLSVLLISCSLSFQETHLTEVPVIIGSPSSQEVNIGIVLQNVTTQVQEVVPNAGLGGIVFSGSCENLSQLKGKVVLNFVGTRFSIPTERTISIVASVDTIQQKMDVHVRDMTDFYWSTDTLDIENDDVNLNEIASKATKQIKTLGLVDCDVTITKLKNSWRIRCGPLENFVQECHFEIDSVTGEIMLLEK